MTITPNEIIARVWELATADPGKTGRKTSSQSRLSGCFCAFVAELRSLSADRKRNSKSWDDEESAQPMWEQFYGRWPKSNCRGAAA
jgi:hypothetical protein